jgi:hypothetical protein
LRANRLHAALPISSSKNRAAKVLLFTKNVKLLLSFLVHYWGVHLLDIEWLLSTLFDASLLKLRAAGIGGSFFVSFQNIAHCSNASITVRPRGRSATMSKGLGHGCWTGPKGCVILIVRRLAQEKQQRVA